VAAVATGVVGPGSASWSASWTPVWMASRIHARYTSKQPLNVFSSCLNTSGVHVSPQHTTGGAAEDVTAVATLTEFVKPRLEPATWLRRRAATPVPAPLLQCVVQRSARVTHQDG
jgi:hypothetical protein